MWCIPPAQSGAFVAAMEDVLDVYCRPYDPAVPVVCMDEQPVQCVRETRLPLAMGRGRPLRVDFEYERNGTAALFLFAEPLRAWRAVHARAQRTMRDWAHEVRWLLDGPYAHVARVCLVCDNLNTHTVGALYEAFPPAEARRLAQRLDIHYTPKHGSWLNIAEIELSALTRQCLATRIPDRTALQRRTHAWATARNRAHIGVDWQFTTADARMKLKRLYPVFQTG